MAELFEAVKAVPILEVAKDLNIQITKEGHVNTMAVCPFHEDHKGGGGEPNFSLFHPSNRYRCHKCGEKGSVLDLFMKVNNITDAVEAAKTMAQIYHVQYDEKKPEKAHVKKWKEDKYTFKTWDNAAVEKSHDNLMEAAAAPHLENFCKLRNVDAEYVKKKKIGLAMAYAIDQEKQFDFVYTIPAFDVDGALLAIRLHSRFVRKNKRFIGSSKMPEGADPTCPYDLVDYNPEAPELWVMEGEGDLWTAQHGLKKNAITTLCGANSIADAIAKNQFILGDLSKKEKIVLCNDNDYTGTQAMARVRMHMPKDANVYRIHWPDNYPKKEDVSYYFNTMGKSFAEFETLLKKYSFEEAEAWLKFEQEKAEAKKKGTSRVYEFGNCYFRIAPKKGKPTKKQSKKDEAEAEVVDYGPAIDDESEDPKISTFVIRGRATVEIGRDGYTRADLEAETGEVEKDHFLPPETWMDKRSFMRQCCRRTRYKFLGTDRDIQDIMENATKNLKDKQIKKGVKYIGFVDHHFVGPGFVISKDGVTEDGPLEYIPQGTPFDDTIKITTTNKDLKEILEAFCKEILKVNKPDVIIPTLGWMFACFFKDEITKILNYFPILSVFGTSGAGKTSLIVALMRLFGVTPGFRLYNANQTKFSVAKMLSCTNSIPLPVDELKENIGRDVVNFWQQKLKNAYFGETETRGNKDQTLTSYEYRAPLLVLGEMSIIREQAIAERTISVRPERHYIDTHKEAKEAFRRIDKDISIEVLFPTVVQWILKEGLFKTKQVWGETKLEMAGLRLQKLSQRVWDNYVTVCFGVNMFEMFAKSMDVTFKVPPETKRQAFGSLASVINSAGDRPKLAFDEFLEALAIMAKSGVIKKEQQYIVDGETLYFHLNSCVPPFRKWARETAWEGEQFGRGELFNQANELQRMKNTYIVHTSRVKRLGPDGPQRCIMIHLPKAERMNLDVSGFGFSTDNEEPSEPWRDPAPTPAAAEAQPAPELPPELTDQAPEPGSDLGEGDGDMFEDSKEA